MPHARQKVFLLLNDQREVYYGGAAGGGKSVALLLAALQYIDVPDYSAVIVRKTFKQLEQPKAIMDMARTCLHNLANWNESKHVFTFDSGAKLTFRHMQDRKSILDFQGPEFQYIGVDEVTDFSEKDYTFLFSRIRKVASSGVPSRLRCASNPIGPGVIWVKKRFVDPKTRGSRIFVPAKLTDNVYLDQADYLESLENLNPVERLQLRDGRWDVRSGIRKYKSEWFKYANLDLVPPPSNMIWVRYWDLAATSAKEAEASAWTASWTAGVLMGRSVNGLFFIRDVVRVQRGPKDLETLLLETAKTDPDGTIIFLEQEPGSSGKAVVERYMDLLSNYAFYGDRVSGNKEIRDKPFSAASEHGKVVIIKAPWNEDYLGELEAIPEADEKDQRDASAGAFNQLLALNSEEEDEVADRVGNIAELSVGGTKRAGDLW
jgi:predicted phage terminase large subunit-like protein